MSGYDGLRHCDKCDNYTTGRLCRSCAEQEMIDGTYADDEIAQSADRAAQEGGYGEPETPFERHMYTIQAFAYEQPQEDAIAELRSLASAMRLEAAHLHDRMGKWFNEDDKTDVATLTQIITNYQKLIMENL